MASVYITRNFKDDLAVIHSDRVLNNILNTLSLLKIVPTMGASNIPQSITLAYGNDIRKIPVDPFDIITKYDGDTDRVVVLGLVHQRVAW